MPLHFGVATAWAVLALTVGGSQPSLAMLMLVAYPAWDAVANYLDAKRSGGLLSNKSQLLNVVVSVVTAIAVSVALGQDMHAVPGIFGTWATIGSNGFGDAGDNQTLLAGAPRQVFVTLRKGF